MGALVDRACDFIENGGDEVSLLADCVEDGTLDALHAVQMLYEDMYDGITFNYELKAPAAFCLIRWGDEGLTALVEAAQRTKTSKNRSLAIGLLAHLASRQIPSGMLFMHEGPLVAQVTALVCDWEALYRAGAQTLRQFVLAVDDEEDLVAALGLQLQHAMFNPGIVAPLFQAMASRWAAVSAPTLQSFTDLIQLHGGDERRFQAFLERHPLMIDPMASEVYPRPDIHGAKEPDFLIRRTDDSFLVVEIETPKKPLMTGKNKLSAQATHAVAQATDYADFLGERTLSIRQHLPSFRRPDCLIVVGLESKLTEDQARALRVDNESRHRAQVVGFDWLERRSRSIHENVVGGPIDVSSGLRIV